MRARYAWEHPDWQVVTGASPDGPFNRSAAILDGVHRSDGEMILVADADCWTETVDALNAAVDSGWAVPHLLLHRLSEESTAKVLAGADPHGLPLDRANAQDSRPYRGHECGTLLAIRRDVLLDVPPDVRFVGWGHEDDAWSRALRTLIGKPWRGKRDLFHLWHPPQPRLRRTVGSVESKRMFGLYDRAKNNPRRMRALVDESKEVEWGSNASSSTT